MRTELPVCTRCCFCLPLRHGLIVWGYFKLVISILILYVMCTFVHQLINLNAEQGYKLREAVFISITVIVAITDIILSIAFIVGCHKKSVKILRAYYIYSMCLLVLVTAVSLYNLGMSIYYMWIYTGLSVIIYGIMESLLFLANVMIQLYIVLVVRSETIKLSNGCQFRFVNNALDAECTLNIENSDGENVEDNKKVVEKEEIGEAIRNYV